MTYSGRKYVNHYDDDEYDFYIIGSDQVFNLELTQNDINFFLPHIAAEKKARYAASIGVSKLSQEQEKIFSTYLCDFIHLSIREKQKIECISNVLPDKKILENLDPVFLNDGDFWREVAAPCMEHQPYILIYCFKNYKKAYSIAKSISEDMRILYISDALIGKDKNVIPVNGVGPKEFLSLINNAEYVITDSFHGTAFSIIFEKNFTVIPYEKTSSRMINLLDN